LKPPVVIEGYVTQRKLSAALQQIVGDAWAGDEITIPGSKRRWDMAYRAGNATVVVEYDGDEHYRNSMRIKVDGEKDEAAAAAGYRIVRFPYWVQLDETTLRHYFGLSAAIEQDFPHGFITTKLFPASFCELGIERFRGELDQLPAKVRDDVIHSLRDRAEEHGIEFVMPSGLRSLLADG
jgi:hypothetical protein